MRFLNQLVHMKVHAHISSEQPLEYNQDQTPLTNQGRFINILANLGVRKILCSLKFIKGRQLKRYLGHQGKSFSESFQEKILLYQMEKEKPQCC